MVNYNKQTKHRKELKVSQLASKFRKKILNRAASKIHPLTRKHVVYFSSRLLASSLFSVCFIYKLIKCYSWYVDFYIASR